MKTKLFAENNIRLFWCYLWKKIENFDFHHWYTGLYFVKYLAVQKRKSFKCNSKTFQSKFLCTAIISSKNQYQMIEEILAVQTLKVFGLFKDFLPLQVALDAFKLNVSSIFKSNHLNWTGKWQCGCQGNQWSEKYMPHFPSAKPRRKYVTTTTIIIYNLLSYLRLSLSNGGSVHYNWGQTVGGPYGGNKTVMLFMPASHLYI